MRNRRRLLAAGVGVAVVGFALPYVQPAARVLLIGLVVLVVAWVVLANPGKIVGALIGWVFLTNATADWRTLRRTGGVILTMVGVALVPAWVGDALLAVGAGIVVGVVTRPVAARVAPRLRPPVLDLDLGDWWAAWRFRHGYPKRAAELGWDRDRRGATDRMRVPALIEARRAGGDWTVVFLSRGDWTPEEWEKQAYALSRSLDGRTVRVSHQGRRVVVRVWTRPLPGVGDMRVTDIPRVTDGGILLGYDAGRGEVRWAADDSTAHGLLVGAPGAGKSHLAGLMLAQAGVTPGWEGVMLDAKGTRDWLWLERYGVRVIRCRQEIHAYLRELEQERQRVEDAGRVDVVRLVVLDEARLILGTHKGKDRAEREESVAVVGDLTGLGRSAGIRFVAIIQRPDVEHVGGGYLRDNLTLRIALGRLEGDGVHMIFEGRQVSPEERRLLDGTPGRALVSGVKGGEMDAWPVQVPELAVDRRGGGVVPAGPEPPLVTPDDDGDEGWTVERMEAAVLAAVAPGVTCRRTQVAYTVGVAPTHGTFRRAVGNLVDRGDLTEGRGPRGAVTVTNPTAGPVPAPVAGQLRLVSADQS